MGTVISIVIKSEGKDISKDVEVISLDTSYHFNEIANATARLQDGNPYNKKEGMFSLLKKKELEAGKKIEILAGYEKGKETTLFKGVITGVEIGRNYNNLLYLDLNIHCDSINMVDLPVNQLFDKDSKDNAIISKLMKDSGVTAGAVAASKIKHTQSFQQNQSAWQCLLQRVMRNGFLFLSTPDDSQVIDPAKHKGTEHKIGTDSSGLENFRLQLDTTSQLKSVKTTSWSVKEQKAESPVEGKGAEIRKFKDADKVLKRKPWEINLNSPLSKPSITAWANAQATYRNLDLYKGWMSFQVYKEGTLQKAKLGDTLKLENFGENFNGKFLVSGVEHKIDTTGWRVRVSLGLSIAKTVFAARDPSTQDVYSFNDGLMVATVAKFKKDPEQLMRIPIFLPGVSPKKEVWARLLSPFSSKEEGLFLQPKEKDEVIVGFWQGDWSQPIIIGSVHNPQNKPPFPYDEKNEKRGMVLKKAELSFLYNEKEKHIQTKAGKKVEITLSEKEGIKNKYDKSTLDIVKDIDLSTQNINLKTKGDVSMDAKGKCKITAKGGTDVS